MQNNGPTLFYDKSTLQSLSKDESYWLHSLTNVMMTSILIVEMMANLEKQPKSGITPDEAVSYLSNKIPSWGFIPSVSYHELVFQNLIGSKVEMSHRPILGGGRYIETPDGGGGMFFDEAPEARIIRRWQEQDFTGTEREIAAQWTRDLQELNLGPIKKNLRSVKQKWPHIKTDLQLLEAVREFIRDPLAKYQVLKLCMETFGISAKHQRLIIERWKALGRPILYKFAPYADFALHVEVYFMFGLAFDIVSDARPKHRSEFAYLFYIPFAKLFV